MIVFYETSLTGVVMSTIFKKMCQHNNIPYKEIGVNDRACLSIKVMKVLLEDDTAKREDLFFIELLPDKATEIFLANHYHDVRSVTVLGDVPYRPHSVTLDKKVRAGLLSFTDLTAAGLTLKERVSAVFSSPTLITDTIARVIGSAHHVSQGVP